jgi:VanZ family protein
MNPASTRQLSTRFLVAAVVYAVLIFAISQVPGKELARLGIHVWDKAIHAAEYLPLGAVLMAWLQSRRGSREQTVPWRDIAITVGLVLVYGALDELHQAFVPGRTVSCADALADTLGGTVGALTTLVFWRRSAGRGHEPLDELDPREEEKPVERLAGDPRNLDDRRDRE